MPLSVKKIRSAKQKDKDHKLPEERGLYVLVNSRGSKLWKLKYRFLGKEKKCSSSWYLVANQIWSLSRSERIFMASAKPVLAAGKPA